LHLSMLVQTQIKERLVLVDKDLAVATNHLAELTEHELVTKANEDLSQMAMQLPHSPPDPGKLGKNACETRALCMNSEAWKSPNGSARRRFPLWKALVGLQLSRIELYL